MCKVTILGSYANFGTRDNVYDKEGISPTLNTAQGGGLTPMIVVEAYGCKMWDSPVFEDEISKEEISGTLLTGSKNMVALKCVGQLEGKMESVNRVYDPDGVAPTLMTYHYDAEPKIVAEEPILLGGIGDKKSNGGSQYYQQDRVYDSNGIAAAHPAQIPEGSYKYMVEDKKHQQDNVNLDSDVSRSLVAGTHGNADIFTKTVIHQQDNLMTEDDICMTQCAGLSGRYNVLTEYAIRKLTPKECFRLMGVKDEDYDKLTVSNSQRYKQAGNSIVVNVLMAIFENLFINDDIKTDRLF